MFNGLLTTTFSPKIEKNVPMTGAGTRRGSDKYNAGPLIKKMEVGDSVFYPSDNPVILQSRLSTTFHHRGRRYKPQRKFSTSVQNGGVRVWRIK